MKPINRRSFLKNSIGAAATFSILGQGRAYAANEKITFAVMGLGGRGTFLAESFAKRDDVEIAYLCDVDTRRFGNARNAVEEVQDRIPKMETDFRRILDDPEVDVLIVATPDHWHAIPTVWACQAGKDVYVEKPMAHNMWEGQKMIEAAEKYKRVVQVGMQSRSAPYMKNVVDYVHSGKIGKLHMIRVLNMMKHNPSPLGELSPVPNGLDYDTWCGPGPVPPYRKGDGLKERWDYGCGAVFDDAIHQLDLARMILKDAPFPKTAYRVGTPNVLNDGREIPDTCFASYEYDEDTTLLFEAGLWMPYMHKIPFTIRDSDQFPNFPMCSTLIEIYGTDAFMYVGRHGGGFQVFDAEQKMIYSEHGRQADKEHQQNFIDCIRSRKQPNANAQQGHYSIALGHMANISYRLGNQKLTFCSETQTFKDNPQANQYLRRTYRKPWEIADQI